MIKVTSAEKPVQVSSTQQAPKSDILGKNPIIFQLRESKFTLADIPSTNAAQRSQHSNKYIGKPNQTAEIKKKSAIGCSDTSQNLTTVQRSRKSLVREAILKFSGKCEVTPHPPENEPKSSEIPKMNTTVGPVGTVKPQENEKSENLGGETPKLALVQPETSQNVTLKSDPPHEKYEKSVNLNKKSPPKRGQKPDSILANKTSKTNAKPQEETLENETSETQTRKNAFKVLKWPPKNQDSPKPKPKAKPDMKNSKNQLTKQQTNNENHVKITSLLKCKPSKVPNLETIKKMEPVENQPKIKVTLKQPTLVLNIKQQQPQGEEEIQQPMGRETTKPTNNLKPNQTKNPIETAQAKPHKRTNSEAKSKQPRKPKPKVVEAGDIRLFLANKQLERARKLENSLLVQNIKPPPPSDSSVSATLPCSSNPPQLSAPSTVSRKPRELLELSTYIQGAQTSSAINEGK